MDEKEYGTFGPAIDAETFFTNPDYYEDDIDTVTTRAYSRYVKELLDGLGYSYDMVKYRQKMWTKSDKLITRHEKVAHKMVTTGGTGEGTALLNESDLDTMYIVKDVICADNKQNFIHQENITVFQTETHETSPGYARLKLLKFHGRTYEEEICSSLFKDETGSDYLSSQLFTEAVKKTDRQQHLREGRTAEPTSGPSAPASDKYQSFDIVVCFRCVCPNILDRWISRPRFKRWPSPETIHKISRLDGHAVPVGLKESKYVQRMENLLFTCRITLDANFK